MKVKPAVIITTINLPSDGIKKAAGLSPDWSVVVIGDKKTPAHWGWPGVHFISFQEQITSESRFARACPANHYSRKNIGYLWAIARGAPVVAETDDDNIPYPTFLAETEKKIQARPVQKKGWENVYSHFSEQRIWPRGFPLELINESLRKKSELGPAARYECAIQQFLVDGDPDVDAVFRLTTEGEVKFQGDDLVLLSGTYSPFNSQNTVWWPEAYPLLYLPSHVSFRMTDIWRSLVAQVCLFETGGAIAFRNSTAFQARNQHSYISDFKDEIPGYLENGRIIDSLASLNLSHRRQDMDNNLRLCYERLVATDVVPAAELSLLELWLSELVAATPQETALS